MFFAWPCFHPTISTGFFLEAWNVWLHNPSIMLMFALSIFAFIGNHLSVLYLLKATSAPQDAMATLGVYLPKRDFVVITTVWLKRQTNNYLVRPPQDLRLSDSHVM